MQCDQETRHRVFLQTEWERGRSGLAHLRIAGDKGKFDNVFKPEISMSDQQRDPTAPPDFSRAWWMMERLQKNTSTFESGGISLDELSGMEKVGGLTLHMRAPANSTMYVDAELEFLLRKSPSSMLQPPDGLRVGDRAPEFEVHSTADGKPVTLMSLRGQPFAMRLTRSAGSGII
jgi:hypothetical protein